MRCPRSWINEKMKTKAKKIKLMIALSLAVIILGTAAAAASLNYHKIYVFLQTQGWFRSPVVFEKVQSVQGMSSYSIDEIREIDSVRFDQSLMLVNREHMLPEGFVPDVAEYKDTTVFMSRPMISAYEDLKAAVLEKTGNKLYVSSDLRSAEEQEELYREDPLTATLPGSSEHQTGLALDVYVAYYAGDGFLKSPSGRFVNSHAHEYGFIIRYPSYGEEETGIRFEPWHIRYVGAPHANIIYSNHITLEEYIEDLEVDEWYECDGYLISRQAIDDGKLNLPTNCRFPCVISPDNTGYYIITIDMR